MNIHILLTPGTTINSMIYDFLFGTLKKIPEL